MINAENISRHYGDFVAVDDVSFEIGHGEIVGLLGHNGAGKTTIMKMLTGFIEPSAGRIQIGDFDIEEQAELAQQLIGYLPEALPVYPEMRVIDYLEYCANLRGFSGDLADQAVIDAIARTELADKALNPIATLSRGYKQRVGVAQAILHKPKLLILDEPTNGLDPHQTLQMRQLLRDLAKDATVILSTHIMQEVDALCDRVLIVRNGQLVINEQLGSLRRCHSLQLHTDATTEQLSDLLSLLGDFSLQVTSPSHYSIPVADTVDADALAAVIAEQLVKQGFRLHALMPQHRDLETLFRQINELPENHTEVTDAV